MYIIHIRPNKSNKVSDRSIDHKKQGRAGGFYFNLIYLEYDIAVLCGLYSPNAESSCCICRKCAKVHGAISSISLRGAGHQVSVSLLSLFG